MLSHVRSFAIPWTVAHQAALSMEFSKPRILEWVAISSSRESLPSRMLTLNTSGVKKTQKTLDSLG